MVQERACRTCRLISTGSSVCPSCKTHTLSDDFTSIIIIIDPEKSEIAKRLNITEPGKYALKVR
ncbi:transcription elongation factor Spt4 [Candidatus Bathyarchaeota archaeon]|nr:transcription elongation factor Spt4 [Candidatus Bathyarchaeota archaeon]